MATATKPETGTKDWVSGARDLATDFATRAPEHDTNDTFVAENYQAMRAAKIFSAPIPSDLGGGGASYAQHCTIIRTLGRGCGSTALAYSMHSHLLQALIWRHTHGATPPAEPLLRRIAAEELVLVSSGGFAWPQGSGALCQREGQRTIKPPQNFCRGGPRGRVPPSHPGV